jgi:hypothetical protein
MRGWPITCALVLASCNKHHFETETRELFHATADGADVAVSAELHGWHTPAHMGPEFRTLPARDDFAILRAVSAKRGGKALPIFDTSLLPSRSIDTPATYDSGKTELASLGALTCPIGHGVAARVNSEWRAYFVLGDRVFESKIDSPAADCAALGSMSAESTLPVMPGGATACLALDEAGSRPAAIDCFIRGTRSDLAPVPPLPKEGALSSELTAEIVKHADRDALVARFAADPTTIDAMITRLATKPPPFEDIGIARERLLAIDAAGALPRFIDRATTECASTCSDDVVKLAELAIGWKGTAFVTPDACAKGISFARTLASKGDAAAMKRAFLVLRGFYSCLGASARPLVVSGLGVATSAETKLASPDAMAYVGVDNNCQAFTTPKGREVSSLCESFPRFAGTWLGAHCGPDAIAAAMKIASDRASTPFDPREDQVLDGALRVLGACDKTAFESAIAHVPETTAGLADIRSKEHLRATFVK